MITQFLDAVDSFVWGVPLLVLIMGTGLLLTIRLKGMQFIKLGRALKYMVRNEEGASGEVTSFGALCTALSATIGTGNIVGVATAVIVGGPGALFWMFIAACVGLATKFTEGVLAVIYRQVNPEGGSCSRCSAASPVLLVSEPLHRSTESLQLLRHSSRPTHCSRSALTRRSQQLRSQLLSS